MKKRRDIIKIDLSGCKNMKECIKAIDMISSGKIKINRIDEFKWTDELVLQFAKVSQSGSYGDYSRVKKIKDKLQRFKELITIDEINRSIDFTKEVEEQINK